MVSSESLKNLFRLKVSPTLISQLATVGVDANTLVEFATTQIQLMLSCKPNCKIYGEKQIWVLRGFFPETPVFFKLTLVKARNDDAEAFSYYARLRHFQANTRRSWNNCNHISYGEFVLFSNDINKVITAGVENALLGADNKIDPLIKGGPGKPKCMSPRGMKLLKYKKPKKEKH